MSEIKASTLTTNSFLKSFVGKLFPPSQIQVAALIRAPGQESAERISESLGCPIPDGNTKLLPAIAEHSNLAYEMKSY
jgi:hypothetical protein